MDNWMSLLSRAFFAVAFGLLALALLDRIVLVFGFTILRGAVHWWRLLELAAMLAVFVAVLQLREIRQLLARGR
jgi:hypothetical protein